MSAAVIPFPRAHRRRRWPEFVEVERCTDPATGRPIFVFEIVTGDARRIGIGMRGALADALDDVAWFRRGGVSVVEIGGPLGAPS